MKCRNLVLLQERRKKGKPYMAIVKKITGIQLDWLKAGQFRLDQIIGKTSVDAGITLDDFEPCGGEIVASVYTQIECCNSSLEIEYKCARCHEHLVAHVEGLPDSEEELSRFLTEQIGEIE